MPTAPPEDDEYLTRTEAAELLRVQPRTLWDWQRAGQGPEAVRVSRNVTLYSRRNLMAFLQSRT